MLIIKNGAVIPGDGHTVLEPGVVYIEGGRIAEVSAPPGRNGGPRDRIVDARGAVVFPGLINTHAHACTVGPLFASGSPAIPLEQAVRNLDRHLRFGTTTVINVDGFALPEEVEVVRAVHPLRVLNGTCHLPVSLEAASKADGRGLTQQHRAATAEELAAAGAVLIGEVGAGHTLGGGGQDYMFIPMRVRERTGVELEPRQAQALKWAVLGRHIDPAHYDRARVAAVLNEVGLAGRLTEDETRELVCDSVLPSFQLGLKGFAEAGDAGRRLGLPVLVHNSAPSWGATRDLATTLGPLLIAGHTNHTTFTVEESLESARELRRLGAFIEVCTLDAFGAKRLVETPDHIHALLASGLVDIWATDYAGGYWDCQLVGLEAVVRAGTVSLPAGIALASRNPARAVRKLADRGELAPGKLADVVIATADRLSEVRAVIIGGAIVYEHGEVRRQALH
ncbi:MAG: amidohydrolase family protein [Armatimonadota bacterium]|nr:amidohydrolase family protein [Armatimonadota bacterium]